MISGQYATNGLIILPKSLFPISIHIPLLERGYKFCRLEMAERIFRDAGTTENNKGIAILLCCNYFIFTLWDHRQGCFIFNSLFSAVLFSE